MAAFTWGCCGTLLLRVYLDRHRLWLLDTRGAAVRAGSSPPPHSVFGPHPIRRCLQDAQRSDTLEDAHVKVEHHAPAHTAAECDAGGERRAPGGACDAGGVGRKGLDASKPWTEEEDAILSEQVRS